MTMVMHSGELSCMYRTAWRSTSSVSDCTSDGLLPCQSNVSVCFRLLCGELGGGVDQRNLLCVLLILEKARGDASKWSPYIDILPQEYGAQGGWGLAYRRAVGVPFPIMDTVQYYAK